MAHFAIEARNALRTALTGLATTGSRVFTAHTRDDALLFSGDLPALVLLTPREDVVVDGAYGVPTYQRTALLEVIVCVERMGASADLGAAVYQIAQEIESAMAAPLTVAGRNVVFHINGAIETESSEQGERTVAMLILPVQALYFTTAGVPDAHA